MKKAFAILIFASLCITCRAAGTAKGFKTESLNIGYMSQNELGKRVEVQDLADYVKKLGDVCAKYFATTTVRETIDIVVVARPDGKSRVWFVSSRGAAANKKRDKLRGQLEGVPAPKISSGAIAFDIQGQIAGGDPKAAKQAGPPPIPDEWKKALSKQDEAVSFDKALAQIWPGSETVVAAAAKTPPPGFVSQVLEPTGGHMFRPKDWFYKEDHHDSVLTWIISQEDTSKGGDYVTGVRIQAYIGVQKTQGKPAKDFIADFVESKKKDATKVIKECSPEDQGLFTRQCFECEQGTRHTLYSLFWGNNGLDLAVIMTSETTKDLWDSTAPTFDKMNSIEIIDMARFQSDTTFKVPPGVNYKEAPTELNDQAKQLLASKFSPKASDQDILSLFQNKLICGPGLWAELKDDDALSKLEKGNVAFHVDAQTLDGKLFQTPDELLLFWKAFTKKMDLGDFKVRRLSENELKIFWSVISFDIEEPVFILESDKHKVVVYFGSGKPLKIMWIDDLENISLKGGPQ